MPRKIVTINGRLPKVGDFRNDPEPELFIEATARKEVADLLAPLLEKLMVSEATCSNGGATTDKQPTDPTA